MIRLTRISVIFLANDLTLVTSYGYCQSLKISDIRLSVMSVLCSVRLGGYSVRLWVGVCTRDTKTLTLSVAHIPIQLILWEYIPRALKCFALASFDQQELFNFPSNALFCIHEVWQGFIRTVVLRLLSRGTNFHSNKHIRNYTQDGLQSKIGNCAACC